MTIHTSRAPFSTQPALSSILLVPFKFVTGIVPEKRFIDDAPAHLLSERVNTLELIVSKNLN